MSHYASLSFFSYTTRKDKWWAFKQMQLAKAAFKSVEGSSFIKLMGCGNYGGFSMWPDFGTYALLSTWEHPDFYHQFIDQSNIAVEFKSRASEHFHILLKPYRSHGSWSGISPFQVHESPPDEKKERIAVITRATISPKKLIPFWKLVPTIGRSLRSRAGLVFSMGMGEWPLFELTTFSIWDEANSMQDFAYQSPQHVKAVKHTKKKGLFKEDLFARFVVQEMDGSWKGSPMSFASRDEGALNNI